MGRGAAVIGSWLRGQFSLFGDFKIHTFIEKKLGLYFAGHTTQVNNFNHLFTRHDRKRASTLMFAEFIWVTTCETPDAPAWNDNQGFAQM